MLKNISRLEHVIGNKTYHFLCDSDSPLDEVKEALFQFLKYVGQIEDQVKASQSKIEEPALPVEDHSVELEQKPAE